MAARSPAEEFSRLFFFRRFLGAALTTETSADVEENQADDRDSPVFGGDSADVAEGSELLFQGFVDLNAAGLVDVAFSVNLAQLLDQTPG